MKLLFVADGRSPIALNWMGYFIHSGEEVHLASTFPCPPIQGLASMHVIPVALSGVYAQSDVRDGKGGRLLRRVLPVKLRTRIRQMLAPSSFPRAVHALQQVVERVRPDLIHAMRIPFEGMISSMAVNRIRQENGTINKPILLLSVWGNDFTLHARSSSKLGDYTRQALAMCDALHTDCQRDLKLARDMGFTSKKPGIVLPAGGGINLDIFRPTEHKHIASEDQSQVGDSRVTIINPRGFRAYVRNDTFFQAIPLVTKDIPDLHFVCTGMAGEAQAQKWIAELGIDAFVELLPLQSQPAIADLFKQAQISLSITTHDGIPNTLLEAMACGCFPIAGDIESIREWITPGENGLLVDPASPVDLAAAITLALSHPELRRQAMERNLQMVRERAEYHKTMHSAEEFYRGVLINQ